MLKKIRSKLSRKKSTSQSTIGSAIYSEIDNIRQRHLTFNELRIASQFTDVVLLSLDQLKFPAHKIILASASSFFKQKCKRETISKTKSSNIIQVPVHSKYLRLIIAFIYTGTIQVEEDNFGPLLEAAELFEMLDLQKALIEYIETNLTIDNIFEMFRSSRLSANVDFQRECTSFIKKHKHKILEKFGPQLNFDEILFIVNLSSSACSTQTLCDHIVRWVKFDPIDRLNHLQALLQDIDLRQLSIGYIDKLFADKVLIQNQYFVKMAVEVFDRKLEQNFGVGGLLNSDYVAVSGHDTDRSIFALTEDGIYTLDLEKEKLKKLRSLENLIDFRSTNYGNNGIVITGSSNRDDTPYMVGTRDCKYFCTSTYEIEEFPAMNSKRVGHQVKTLNNQIFACGGMTNTMEFFDPNEQKWFNGPNMCHEKGFFEMITRGESSLYTFGGCLWDSSRFVEHYDIRANTWNVISDKFPSPDQYRVVLKDNIVYCFRLPWIQRFDLRVNKWMEIYNVPESKVIFPPNEFDCIAIDEDIYIMGQFYTFGTRTLKYDDKKNKFERLDLMTNCCKNFNNFRFVKV